VVRDAERRGRVLGVRLPPEEDDAEPWTAPPSRRMSTPPIVGELPQPLELALSNQIYIAKEGLHPGLRNRVLRPAAFPNLLGTPRGVQVVVLDMAPWCRARRSRLELPRDPR
jgi:hypothetical protein